MVQRKHLPEAEIQRLERIDNSNLLAFELSKLDEAGLALKVHELLVSYRLAARVANRAFRFMLAREPDNEAALKTALQDYAPEHFPDVSDAPVLRLITLYERSEGVTSVDELRELLYQEIELLQKGSP